MMRGAARPARFAGRLYPPDRSRLAAALASPTPPSAEAPRLLLLPHGGAHACGAVLAAGLACSGPAQGACVLLGPRHAPLEGEPPLLFDPRPAWELFGARLPLETPGLLHGLEGAGPGPEAHEQEHSLEVPLAWMVAAGWAPRPMPMLLAPGAPETLVRTLAERLWAWIEEDEERMLVASTDLDHYHEPPANRAAHMRFLECLEAGDPGALEALLSAGAARPCGGDAARVWLHVAGLLGRRVRGLAYGWAGEAVGGEVGFLAAVA